MLEAKSFLPKKGNYRDLIVYQKAVCIYDITFFFTKKFLSAQKDRTVDQMVQAARSGKQNIAEGSAAASTSAETEIKLTNVARASMQELLVDYEDYLRVRHLPQWGNDDERTRKVKAFSVKHNNSEDYMRDIEQRTDDNIANIAITLIHQFDAMMGKFIARLEKDFVEQGGIREQMTSARLGYRNEQRSEIERLTRENQWLKARVADLERMLGANGAGGADGSNGADGANEAHGANEIDGADRPDEADGANEIDGADRPDEADGANGSYEKG